MPPLKITAKRNKQQLTQVERNVIGQAPVSDKQLDTVAKILAPDVFAYLEGLEQELCSTGGQPKEEARLKKQRQAQW